MGVLHDRCSCMDTGMKDLKTCVLTSPDSDRSPSLSRMDRVEKALHAVDLGRRGLEIGPSYNPLVPKASGHPVETVDHASRTELVDKYRGYGLDEAKISQIEEVDYVWHGGSLLDVVTDKGAYGYIVASHFIEHTVDLIAFLQECEALLEVDGLLTLVIPDKRYCFDRFQPLSTVGDVIDAHHRGGDFHPAGAIVDHYAYACTNHGAIVWTPGDGAQLAIQFEDLSGAVVGLAQALEQKEYIDTHRWKFTPASFDLLLADLAELDMHEFGVVERHDTLDFEFFVTLRKGLASDAPRDRLIGLLAVENELAAAGSQVRTNGADGNDVSYGAAIRFLGEDTDTLRSLNLQLQREVDDLHRSTSWRVTAPLRAVADRLRAYRRR